MTFWTTFGITEFGSSNWIQNKMTDGSQKLEQKLGQNLVQKLEPEQAEGWSR